MKVKDFIKTFGVDKLIGQPIQQNNKIYKIVCNPDELQYHSLSNKDWLNSKERLDKYHDKGSYRFYAKDENNMCIWVYGETELMMNDEVSTAIQENNIVLDFIKEYQSKNEYNPMFLDEYNKKFNAEFNHFLNNAKVSQKTKDFFKL